MKEGNTPVIHTEGCAVYKSIREISTPDVDNGVLQLAQGTH